VNRTVSFENELVQLNGCMTLFFMFLFFRGKDLRENVGFKQRMKDIIRQVDIGKM